MMSRVIKEIMIKAVMIRLEQGEELNKILDSYTKLTNEDKEEILKIVEQMLDTR